MLLPVLASLAVLVALAVVVRRIDAARSRREAEERTLARLGFAPCPEEADAVRETVERIERIRGHDCEVRDLRRLDGDPPVHRFTTVRGRGTADEVPHAEETLLFPVRNRTPDGVVLVVKPSALAPGLATRLIGAVATAGWAAQPDDLHRIEIPPALRSGNVIGALGPRGASLHDVVDPGLLAVLQDLGNVGAVRLTLRDGWCLATSGGRLLPFELEDLLARIRPVLAREAPVTPLRVRKSA